MPKCGPRPAPLTERLMKHIRFEGDCWIWVGAKDRKGYGRVSYGHANCELAHRMAYIAFNGQIPNKLLHHRCQNPACINPAHLEPTTHKIHAQLSFTRQDIIDRFAAVWDNERSKTHCPRGHPYDLLNTYFDSKGERSCRQCHRERQLKLYWRRRNGDTEKQKPWASHQRNE